jgi:hypothetical protein
MHIRKPLPPFVANLPRPLILVLALLTALIVTLALSPRPPAPPLAPASGTTTWREVPCPTCCGTGKVHAPDNANDTGEYVCWACGGSGTLLEESTGPAAKGPAGKSPAAKGPSIRQVPTLAPPRAVTQKDAAIGVLTLTVEAKGTITKSPPATVKPAGDLTPDARPRLRRGLFRRG